MPDANEPFTISVVDSSDITRSAIAQLISSLLPEAEVARYSKLAELTNNTTQSHAYLVHLQYDALDTHISRLNSIGPDTAKKFILLHAHGSELSRTHPTLAQFEFLDTPLKYQALLSSLDKRLKTASPVILSIGRFRFEYEKQVLTEGSERVVQLTEKEADILKFLAQHNGESVSSAVILEAVWGYGNDISTRTLTTHIYTLRQKIEFDASNPDLILADEGGYKLNVSPP